MTATLSWTRPPIVSAPARADRAQGRMGALVRLSRRESAAVHMNHLGGAASRAGEVAAAP